MSDRDAEAAHWFARMRASDAATDRAAFDAWHADPANAEAYAHAEEDWLLTAGVAPEYLAAHRKPTGKPALSRAHWALAASLTGDKVRRVLARRQARGHAQGRRRQARDRDAAARIADLPAGRQPDLDRPAFHPAQGDRRQGRQLSSP